MGQVDKNIHQHDAGWSFDHPVPATPRQADAHRQYLHVPELGRGILHVRESACAG